MDAKKYLTNKSFCPLPWTGFYYQMDGEVKNCTQSYESIGNIKQKEIEDITMSDKNMSIRQGMLHDTKPKSCAGCYKVEQGLNKLSGVMSSRLYYLAQLKNVSLDTYELDHEFDLRHVDLRWQNTCNLACVYCGPLASSRWERELGVTSNKPDTERYAHMKSYVFQNAHKLVNIYLAGGEPLLMTENEELLDILLSCNPSVEIRVNTNLSNIDTKVFDLLKKFPNVHWTLSVETMEKEFEYIRFGARWNDFIRNIDVISELKHKITFNMLWFVLNPFSLFDTVDFFINKGFGPNSFALSPILGPSQLDIRNLSGDTLQSLETLLKDRISMNHGYLLQDGYRVLINHLQRSFIPDPQSSMDFLSAIDARRRLDSRKIFKKAYELMENTNNG